jgi:predicted AlkP superfamily pyrophosphatase or phosphodiesterase
VKRTLLILLAAATALGAAPARQPGGAPRLVVLLVADQMRADYVARFHHRWRSGMRVLLDEGAQFTRAEFPYLNTVTCAGHATIGTGAYPRTHGLVLNGWWHPDTRRYENCTDDADAPHVTYGRPAASGSSARRLLVPTLADELRAQKPGARVVSLALKARSAVPLAGGAADAAVWFDEPAGSFVTSRAFSDGPVAAVRDFIAGDPFERDAGTTWTLQDRGDTYREPDAAIGERPVAGWSALFPHPVVGRAGTDAQFVDRWQKSPLSTAYLARMGVSLVERLRLGGGEATDYLAVSFSGLDLMGHDFGPRSREVEDYLIHLDAAVGALIQRLDEVVGRERYTLALTSDHGVADIPEQQGAGRLITEDVQQAAEQALIGRWGLPAAGTRYVESVAVGHVYFAEGLYERRLRGDGAAMRAVFEAIEAVPGVRRILRAEELSPTARDPIVRAAALGYVRGRSGDLIVVPRRHWILELRADSEATEHGTMYEYDRRVPLLLLGHGVRPGRYSRTVSPADIAPTLAELVGIRLPHADGRSLREALR